MKERTLEAGEIVYREGEPGEAVYIIRSGAVEVLRDLAGQRVRLTVLREGGIFGEMGVIRDRPRSTTARTVGPTELVEVPKAEFLATFDRDNPLAMLILETLCGRLHEASDKLLENRLFSEAARLALVGRMRLLPASREVQNQIGTDGVEISSLPFRVGRHLGPDEAPADGGSAELLLRAPGSAEISPLQFAIEERDGRLVVRDLDSELGTLVNGRRIAQFEFDSTADLRLGENTIHAGGAESPYGFHLIVEPAASAAA